MKDVYYPSGEEPLIAKLRDLTNQDYTGTTFELHITDACLDVQSLWRDGSRSYYTFVDLDTHEMRSVAEGKGARVILPPRIVCVERTYVRGRDMGLRIYVHPRDLSDAMLPRRVTDLTPDEGIALRYIARYKASFGRDYNHRFTRASYDTGISQERWNVARASLIKRKLLNKAGAILPAGRNAIKS